MSYRPNPELEFIGLKKTTDDHVENSRRSIPLAATALGKEFVNCKIEKPPAPFPYVDAVIGIGAIALIFLIGGLISFLYSIIPGSK